MTGPASKAGSRGKYPRSPRDQVGLNRLAAGRETTRAGLPSTPGPTHAEGGATGSPQCRDLLSADPHTSPPDTPPGGGTTDEAGFRHHSPVPWDGRGSSEVFWALRLWAPGAR